MKSAIGLLSVIALMSFAAVAKSSPNRVYRPSYNPRPEELVLHERDYSTVRGSPAVIQDPSPHKEFHISPGILDGIVRVVFIAPDKGRVTVNLMNANDDILIQIDTRFDWNTWTNTVVLNSKKADGAWGQEVQAERFPFRCCGLYNNIYVEIRESAFIISANGADVASYPYRENLGPPVDVVVYNFEDDGASMKAQYTGTGVYYY